MSIGRENVLGIARRANGEPQGIMKVESSIVVVQSMITFDDDQLVIIQTLKNGSQVE